MYEIHLAWAPCPPATRGCCEHLLYFPAQLWGERQQAPGLSLPGLPHLAPLAFPGDQPDRAFYSQDALRSTGNERPSLCPCSWQADVPWQPLNTAECWVSLICLRKKSVLSSRGSQTFWVSSLTRQNGRHSAPVVSGLKKTVPARTTAVVCCDDTLAL